MKKLELGVGERLVKSSPNAVSAAAEYFLPWVFEPTVVPSMSLKYVVPLEMNVVAIDCSFTAHSIPKYLMACPFDCL